MRIVVVIPTFDRRETVVRMVAFLTRQTRPPDAVVISIADEKHVPEDWHQSAWSASTYGFPIVCLSGRAGSTCQRNLALNTLLGTLPQSSLPPVLMRPLGSGDVVTFFDDDFLPTSGYLDSLEKAFSAQPTWAVLFGTASYDGATNAGYTFDKGAALVAELEERPAAEVTHGDYLGAYGCNMSFRAEVIGTTRFDERLPLYGWQEDVDFASRMRRSGRVIWLSSLAGVHLGTKAGRVKGVRFGYSQIANPLYLINKGTMPARFGVNLMTRNFAANITKSIWPESYVDRRGRLYGNLMALWHAATGRVRPEYVLEI